MSNLPTDTLQMLPSPIYASKLTVLTSANDIIVNLGQSRQSIDQKTGVPSPNLGVEWFAAIALSPVTARQLHDALGEAIRLYVDEFGPIPEDKQSSMETFKGN